MRLENIHQSLKLIICKTNPFFHITFEHDPFSLVLRKKKPLVRLSKFPRAASFLTRARYQINLAVTKLRWPLAIPLKLTNQF